jgi:hypothetical protein
MEDTVSRFALYVVVELTICKHRCEIEHSDGKYYVAVCSKCTQNASNVHLRSINAAITIMLCHIVYISSIYPQSASARGPLRR